jgi:hypothetical protein
VYQLAPVRRASRGDAPHAVAPVFGSTPRLNGVCRSHYVTGQARPLTLSALRPTIGGHWIQGQKSPEDLRFVTFGIAGPDAGGIRFAVTAECT